MGELLRMEGLRVTYRTKNEIVEAVNDVSLRMDRGQTLGLVGETGAGKTTLALAIMGLLPKRVGRIEQGEIFLENENLLSLKESVMRTYRGNKIAMIYQDPMTSLNPVVTVGDQILEVLELHRGTMPKRKMHDYVDEMMELVGIPAERKTEYPHQFSGGMKQRVVIAMALACEPQLLIADEPTTALDVTIQAQILKLIAGLKKDLNTSMLLITHDLGVVAQTCDTMAIMYAGEIVESGSVEDIFEGSGRHPYTEGLFGSIPKLAGTERRLQSITGLSADPTNLPRGCKFHPRCPRCLEICKTEHPALQSKGTHSVRCHLFDSLMEGGNANGQCFNRNNRP